MVLHGGDSVEEESTNELKGKVEGDYEVLREGGIGRRIVVGDVVVVAMVEAGIGEETDRPASRW